MFRPNVCNESVISRKVVLVFYETHLQQFFTHRSLQIVADDFFAEDLESCRIERDVVIGEEDTMRSPLFYYGKVVNDSFNWKFAEALSIHPRNAAKSARKSASARSFPNVIAAP